jgi:secreted trypsin-like serine protease
MSTIQKIGVMTLSAAIAVLAAGTSGAQESRKTPLDLVKERMEKGLSHQKIILGKPAPAGAYPFQVSMISSRAKKGQEFDGHFCGAALIAPTWVLTAAHCVTENGKSAPAKSIEVYVGSQDFHNGDRIPVKSVFRHPDYNAPFFENDVAVLQLTRAPKRGTKYQTIQLVDPSKEDALAKPGTTVTVIGWGTTEQGQLSPILQHATIKIVDPAICNKNLLVSRAKSLERDLDDLNIEPKFRISEDSFSEIRKSFLADITRKAGAIVTDSMICAGEPDPSPSAAQVKDTCQGDSGGPLVAKASNGAPVEVGIVSWGDGCGTPRVHGVYTRLGKLVGWVTATARD